jgi:drug/metabolite transporter (DMT)-like permease
MSAASQPEEGRWLPDPITLAVFALLVILVGSNVVAIRVGARELDPFWGAGVRFAIAAAAFVAVVKVRHLDLPSGRAFWGALLYGFVGIAVYFAFVYWGLEDVKAGYGAVLLSLTPLLTLVLATAHGIERFRLKGLTGALIAAAGVATIFKDQITHDVPLASVLAIVAAAACAAEAAIVLKRFGPISPVAMNAVAMTVAAPMLLAISLVSGETQIVPEREKTWLSFAYITTAGTMGVFLLYLLLLKRWTATATSYQFVLAPVVALPLAAILLNEDISSLFIAGGALVVGGVYLGALSPDKTKRAVPHVGTEVAD